MMPVPVTSMKLQHRVSCFVVSVDWKASYFLFLTRIEFVLNGFVFPTVGQPIQPVICNGIFISFLGLEIIVKAPAHKSADGHFSSYSM